MPSNPLPQPRLPWPGGGIAKQTTPGALSPRTPALGPIYHYLPLLGLAPDASPDTAPLSSGPCPHCALASDALASALSLIGRMARSYDFSPDEIDAVEAEIRAALERVAG